LIDNLILIAAIAGIVVIFLLAVRPAPAGEVIPSQFHGRWCRSTWETIYRRCRERADEWQFTIDRTTLTTEESTCIPLAIRKKGDEYRVRLACRADSPDMPPLGLERWRIGSNGTRLQVLRERE
jgi:hypothetical protein